ncbi:unnamed protein product [Brachionus calyciflorus]|uniref:Uncharacterized protein n=1 Tax=Brachionus calyciflorus TaxID=104777 RepID=A0A814AVW0_9BILA|nr:unnamed protein product [Brachionus calyciflorus]
MLKNNFIILFSFLTTVPLNLGKYEIIPSEKFVSYISGVKIKSMKFFDFIENVNVLEIKIENFNNFDQIKLNSLNDSELKIKQLIFVPYFSSNIILDKNFNLEFKTKVQFLNILKICLVNIKGFESNSNLFEIKNRLIRTKVSLYIYYSKLKFQNEYCELKKLKELESFLVFKSVTELLLSFTVKFFPKTCPYIFKNNHLSKLKINGLADTFVNRNILNFKAINLTENETLNCTISELTIHVYKGVLSSNLLDKNIFINLQKLQINGFIDSIVVANLDRILTSIVNDYYFMDGIYDYLEKPVKNTFTSSIFNYNYDQLKRVFDLNQRVSCWAHVNRNIDAKLKSVSKTQSIRNHEDIVQIQKIYDTELFQVALEKWNKMNSSAIQNFRAEMDITDGMNVMQLVYQAQAIH